jgi:dynein heavy chain
MLPQLDMHFIYSLAWSFGGVTDEAGRKQLTDHLRSAAGVPHALGGNRSLRLERSCLIPEGAQTANDYFVDKQRWVSWREKLRQSPQGLEDGLEGDDSFSARQEVIVSTTESLKVAKLLELCLASGLPVLLVGPTGTGKSVSVRQFLASAERSKRTSISITFSARTTTR